MRGPHHTSLGTLPQAPAALPALPRLACVGACENVEKRVYFISEFEELLSLLNGDKTITKETSKVIPIQLAMATQVVR